MRFCRCPALAARAGAAADQGVAEVEADPGLVGGREAAE